MRGKTRVMLAAASVAAVALVISLVSVSTAATVTKITVIEHAVTDTVVDTGVSGDSTGDLLTWHNELFDADNTTVVGTDQGDCIRTEAGGGGGGRPPAFCVLDRKETDSRLFGHRRR